MLIGKDTRISGYLMEAALEAGLSAAGVDVYLCGPLPTPGIAYLTRALRLSAGIVISASHNPFDDNGMKFFSATGAKLPDDVELSIERRMDEPLACVSSAALGKARRVDDAAGRYVEFCKSTFPSELDLRGWRIVVDCANGAGYHVAPPVFHELGAEVIAVGNEPDGVNINAGIGATHPAFLAEQVRAHKADIGIALDGDGDRLVMADGDGRALRRRPAPVRDRHRLPAAQRAGSGGVVGTQMSNLGFEQALAAREHPARRARRSATATCSSRCSSAGGCWAARTRVTSSASTSTRPATRSSRRSPCCARCIEQKTHARAGDVGVTMFPQRLINVPVRRGFDWHGNDDVTRAEREAVASLGEARPRAAAAFGHRARAARDGRGARRAPRRDARAIAGGNDRARGGRAAVGLDRRLRATDCARSVRAAAFGSRARWRDDQSAASREHRECEASRDNRARRRCCRVLRRSSASGIVPAALAQAAALSASQIAGLSRALTGFAYDDPALASSMLRALAGGVRRTSPQQIAALASVHAARRLGDALRDAQGSTRPRHASIVALYSGIVETPKVPSSSRTTKRSHGARCRGPSPTRVCGGVHRLLGHARPPESK